MSTEGSTTPGPEWVSAAEAADAAGVTPGLVRAWARKGLIVSQPGRGLTGEQVMVRLDEVFAQADGREIDPDPEDVRLSQETALAPMFQSFPDLVAELMSMTERAVRAETKLQFVSEQTRDLKTRLTDAEDQLGAKIPSSFEIEPEPEPEEEPESPTDEAPEPTPEWPAADRSQDGDSDRSEGGAKEEVLPPGWRWPDEVADEPKRRWWRRRSRRA